MTERPEHPELDGSDLPDLASALAGSVDMTPLLARRFAWDTTACADVPDLLTELGLVHGSPEGMEVDHRESHERMAQVLPLESPLRAYAGIVGTVLTTSILAHYDTDMTEEDELGFAQQNAEVILAGARAIVSQLMFSGALQPGPMFRKLAIVTVDGSGE